MSGLYNEEIKERFLSNYDNEGTKLTIRHAFMKSNSEETRLGKDLYNFSLFDLKNVFKELNPKTLAVSVSYGGFIRQYFSWAIKTGLRDDNSNPLNGVDRSWYYRFVDKTTKTHFSEDEFNDLLEQLPNAQDQAFLRLMFEGIVGKSFSELIAIHYNDIDWNNNLIYIKDRDKNIEVSDRCMRYVQNAYKAETYHYYVSETGDYNEKELLASDFLFKQVKSPRARDEGKPITSAVFYTRLANIKEEFDLEYLTPNAVKQSGMIALAAQLYKERNKFDYEEFEVIGDRYNFSKITNRGFEYYNSHLMSNFINKDNLKELYDLDVPLKR